MSKELKKLSKEQHRSVHSLFIEGMSVPMLILATTVLFSAIDKFEIVDSWLELITLVSCAIAIPVLGISIFARRAVAVVSSKLEKLPNSVENCEVIGFALSFIGFCNYLGTVFWWLGWVALLSGIIATLMHYNYLKNARKK